MVQGLASDGSGAVPRARMASRGLSPAKQPQNRAHSGDGQQHEHPGSQAETLSPHRRQRALRSHRDAANSGRAPQCLASWSPRVWASVTA